MWVYTTRYVFFQYSNPCDLVMLRAWRVFLDQLGDAFLEQQLIDGMFVIFCGHKSLPET